MIEGPVCLVSWGGLYPDVCGGKYAVISASCISNKAALSLRRI